MIGRLVEGDRRVTPSVLPAAVSLALSRMLDGEPHPATVLGVADPAVWIGRADDVLMVSTSDAVRLPNCAVVAIPTSDRPFGAIRPGETVLVGDGAIAFPSFRVVARRWFDPVPALPVTTVGELRQEVVSLDGVVASLPDHGLMDALIRDDDGAAFEAAQLLIGAGDGLTPRGDDLIAGTVAAALLIGRSLGVEPVVAMIARLEGPFLDHASGATTSLSASLLRHAFRGEVAEPAAALLSALMGRGDAAVAAVSLNGVGHSSGPALAAGVLSGATAVIERSN